jgi:hypothetical protein
VKLLAGIAVGFIVLLARTGIGGACSQAPASAAFVGTVTAIDGSSVTYRVDGIPKLAAAGISAGKSVAVVYFAGSERFIQPGHRYLVYVYFWHAAYQSDVQGAHACGISTYNTDGTTIDTMIATSGNLSLPLVAAAAGLASLLAAMALAGRRHPKREPAPDEGR